VSFQNATKLVEKQLKFIESTFDQQLIMMKTNKMDLSSYGARVENLLPFEQWSEDKLKIYFYLQKGVKGIKAQYVASKLMFLYEQWCQQHDSVKYQRYNELFGEFQKKEWIIWDNALHKMIDWFERGRYQTPSQLQSQSNSLIIKMIIFTFGMMTGFILKTLLF
jgi:hypothetical protein